MRNYDNIDRYINKLYADIYEQPEDVGHLKLAQKVVTHWMSRLTTCHSVLDVGCGQGMCQFMFEQWGTRYEGIALGEDVVKAQELGRNVKRMDFSFLDYPDNSFDLIFARHAWEHSPMPLITAMEWNRVATNWLGVVLPAPEWYGFVGRNHYSVMTMEQAKNLLDVAGWRVVWEDIATLRYGDETDPRPHEYWLMLEKRR